MIIPFFFAEQGECGLSKFVALTKFALALNTSSTKLSEFRWLMIVGKCVPFTKKIILTGATTWPSQIGPQSAYIASSFLFSCWNSNYCEHAHTGTRPLTMAF